MNFHGFHRYTKDLDVWVAVDEPNSVRLSQVLQEFGFGPRQVAPYKLRELGAVFMFGREPVRIDVLTAPTALEFEPCWTRRQEVDLDGIKVPFLSLEDLRANKRASGRRQDLLDLENLPEHPLWPPPAKRASRKPKNRKH